MDRKRLEHRIKEKVVKALELDIEPSDIPDNEILFGGGFGVDSVSMLEILVAIEEEFEIEIEDENFRVEEFSSIRQLAEYIDSAIQAKNYSDSTQLNPQKRFCSVEKV